MEQQQRRGHVRRLIVPLVLAVSTIGTLATLATVGSSTSGCGDNDPPLDAATGDMPVDTPPI